MPRLLNLLRRPEVSFVIPQEGNPRVTEVGVEGLACTSLCVCRTEEALRALPGVTQVRFREEPDRFLVETTAPGLNREAVDAALASVVVAPWARRWIAAIAERLGLIRRAEARHAKPKPPDRS